MQLTRLGPYEIDKPLGKGGMGSVYAATDTNTGQRVAIKALTPQLAMAEGFRERFEAEIESLKTLKHDGIVRLYGYGEQDGALFYSMELVEGISLEDELKAGRRFNWREVTNIAIQLSLALKHAHDHGIIHRDIKPANILLTADDHVKLADFGIARLFGTTSLTTAGGVLGTADYMSPEQADGRPVTARCDQYSLGGVMYALLAGRPPFRAKNLPQMLQMQRFANPEPVRRYAPDTPEQLERVISQLLAKDPADRFPNTQVLARHLQAMVNALSRPTTDDDFSLSAEHAEFDRPPSAAGESIDIRQTQAERTQALPGKPSQTAAPGPGVLSASQNAATMAADELLAKQSGLAGAVTTPNAASSATMAPARPTRFTTLEEEEQQRRRESERPWLLVAAQLLTFVAVLAGLGGLAWYLSRPATADQLYSEIMTRTDADDVASLAKAESELSEFLTRYPDDPRARVLHGFQDRLELDRWERLLRRQTQHGAGLDHPLSPAEQLYLQASSLASTTPDKALSMLESLVALYGADEVAAGKSAKKSPTANVVEMARRRIEKLRPEVARQRELQLADINDRLAAAEKLSRSNAGGAAAMYQAIIDLHGDERWAAELVTKARNRLAEIKKP